MSNNMTNRAKIFAEMLGISYEEAMKMVKDFQLALCNFDSGASSIELLVDSISDIIQEDEEVRLEQPLWLKHQQNKHFKRGKS